jgi:hypothetical protein
LDKYSLTRFIYRFKDLPISLWLLDETIRNAGGLNSCLPNPYIKNNVLFHSYESGGSNINVMFEVMERKSNPAAMVVRVQEVELI